MALILFLIPLAFCIYHVVTFKQKLAVSSELVARAQSFELKTDDRSVSLLVLGDSTAVGVGADSSGDSVAGRFAVGARATYVENQAMSGAQVKDLEGQIAKAELKEYSYILIEIGGNDIIRFNGAELTAGKLKSALEKLPKAKKVIVHSAGNVGAATFFPKFLRTFYSPLNLDYHREFEKVVAEAGGTYVNLYKDPKTDPFVLQPEVYLSADGLHPSSAGYRLWFEKIRESL